MLGLITKMNIEGRIEYPKELEAEIQAVCDLANQGEQEEAFRLLRDLQEQGKVNIILEDRIDL